MTEKSYNPKQKEKKVMKKQEAVQTPKKQIVPKTKVEDKKEEILKQEKKIVKEEFPKVEEKKVETPKPEEVKKKIEVVKIKKDKAVVNGRNVPISTKYAVEICKFIKYKPIEIAISNLEQVLAHKKAIPMKGEYGHKKGKKMAGGKYPKKATEHFIRLLKSLSANAVANSLDEPIISEAVANIAPRPMARFGRWQRKRTHVKIVAKEKKVKKQGGKKK